MALSQTQRRWWLGVALAATLAAVAWIHAGNDGTDDLAQPGRPGRREAARPQPGPGKEGGAGLRLDLLRRPPAQDEVGDAFASQSWYVPPPPPKPSRPQPPSAPPLPFAYLGKMLEDGQLTVFLSRQDRNYVVKRGDVLDGSYRVESIEPPLMTLTYLPLNIKQTIQIGGLD